MKTLCNIRNLIYTKTIKGFCALNFLLAYPAYAENVSGNVGLNQADLAYIGFVASGIAATKIKEPDKSSHYFAGMAIGGFVTAVSNPYYGIIGAGLAGAAKEAYDKENGVADWDDFGYTVAGGAIASGLVYLLHDYDKSIHLYKDRPMIGYSKQF